MSGVSCEHCGRTCTQAPRTCDDCEGAMCFNCTEQHDELEICPMGNLPGRRFEYDKWIAALVARNKGQVQALCEIATQNMKRAFPELRRVRGHVRMVDAPDGDKRPWPHWWLITADDTIVDPTRSQFPCSQLEYEAIDESKGEAVGTCCNCSAVIYRTDEWTSDIVCSEACGRAYADYCSRPFGG